MWQAANQVGFFTLINHGIPQSLIETCFDRSKKFFDLPKEEKQAASPHRRDLNAGYEYMTQVRPSTGTPDQKECVQIPAAGGVMDGHWPRPPADFEPIFKDFMEHHCHKLALRVVTMLESKGCKHLKPGTIASSCNMWAKDGQSNLPIIHYPLFQDPDKMPEDYWRCGAHTDWSLLTLLFQLPGNEGLEATANPRSGNNDGWLKVDPLPGGIAVNVGDMLYR